MDPPTPIDAMTALSHKIIRASCGDDFDPFMLGNAPEEGAVIVRACFYYAVVMTEKTTVMFDNYGRGGMCDLVPDEMVACWDTPALLESQGVDFQALRAGTARLGDAPVPRPFEIVNDLPGNPEHKSCESVDDPPYSARYEKRVSLRGVLADDAELFNLLAPEPAPSGPARSMRP